MYYTIIILDIRHPIVLSEQILLADHPNPTIPCKPTSKKSSVDLISINRLVIAKLKIEKKELSSERKYHFLGQKERAL